MARPLRMEFEGALYHVTTRGDRREAIFHDDIDRHALLRIVGQSMARFDAVAYAYCLMSNHYHFVMCTHQPNLSRLMRHINGVYTQAYNRRNAQVGHLFQGRFKSILVDKDAYFLEVCRYVDLNPVRAHLARRPQDWKWSSYRAHAGLTLPPAWLDSGTVHRQLGGRTEQGPQRYAQFVAAGQGVRLWDSALTGQIYLGDDRFMHKMQVRMAPLHHREIPNTQRRFKARPLDWYLAHHDRDTAIVMAYLQGRYTQTAIAGATRLSVSRVSRLIAACEAKGKT